MTAELGDSLVDVLSIPSAWITGFVARVSMVTQLVLPNPRNEPLQELYERELFRLKEPGILREQLMQIDKTRPFRRIYVMGCGRSGTWLLTHVMSTFKNTEVVPEELAFEYFGLLATDRSVLVLKRDHVAYQRIEDIPGSIEIAYIVRHPFDVLTSHLPSTKRPYHILPHRWLGEMMSLQYLFDTRREQTKIIRYEDLVGQPLEVQAGLANFFGLRVDRPIDTIYTSSKNPTESPVHFSRKIDVHSIDKYKRDPKKLEYLRLIKPRIGRMLEWVAGTYGYNVSL